MGELKCLVDFIYNGEASIVEDGLESFLQTASELQIKGIQKKPLNTEDMNKESKLDKVLNFDIDYGPFYPPEGPGNEMKILQKTEICDNRGVR